MLFEVSSVRSNSEISVCVPFLIFTRTLADLKSACAQENAVAVDVPSNDSVTFEDSFFSGRYFRLVYGGGPTTGTISIILTEKL